MTLPSGYPLTSEQVAAEYGLVEPFSSEDLYGKPGLPAAAPLESDDLLGASNIQPLAVVLSEDTTPYGSKVAPPPPNPTTQVTTSIIRATATGGDWQGGAVDPVFTVEWLNGGTGANSPMAGPGFFTVNTVANTGDYERYSFTSPTVGPSSYPYWSNFRVRCVDAAGNVAYSSDFYVEIYVNAA